MISLSCLARDKELSSNTSTKTGRRKPFVVKDSKSRDGSSGQTARESRSTFGQGDLLQIMVTHIEHPTSIQVIAWRIPRDHTNTDRGVKISTPWSNFGCIANKVKFSIDTSPPGRFQPALSTGKQREKCYQEHGIGVPLPLFGRPGSSGELGSTPQETDHYSTTFCLAV